MLIWARSGKQSHGGDRNLPARGISTFSFQLGFSLKKAGWKMRSSEPMRKLEMQYPRLQIWFNTVDRSIIRIACDPCPRLFSWANSQLNSSIYRPGSNVAFYIQQFRERLSEKMSTRKFRKVIWDMIKTLFLTLKLSNFALILTNIRPQASRAIL